MDDNELNVKLKIPFHKRTCYNYTHNVNIDSQIDSISTWRKSKIKFNIALIKNIFSLGILHIISLYYPKLYIRLYCKPCPPKESDFFLIEDIHGYSLLCKSIYKRPRVLNSSSGQNISLSKIVSFEYKTIRYEYNESTNTIIPIYFNISLITNNELVYKYSEGINSRDDLNILIDKYGKNEMKLNKHFIYEYFLKQNLPQFIITLACALLFAAGGEVGFGNFIFYLSLLMILIRVIYKCIRFKQLFYANYSLDGQKKMKKYKVIRKDMQQPQNKYSYIYNNEIIPGDVLLLREEDIIPCDGVILEGECILSTNYLLGNSDPILRSSLESNDNYFNYVKNKKNIIFHGMKIIKIYTKNNSKEITVLAINTGPNTFKANLFSNLIIKRKDKEIFKSLITKSIDKYYLIFSIVLFVISITTIILLYYLEENHNPLKEYSLNILGSVLMPINYILENIIKLLSVIHLNNYKVHCTDETYLPESGYIDTVIFSKSGNKAEYKIIAFCPLYFEPGTKKILFKGCEQSEEENINQILDSHMEYYRKIAINIDNNDGFGALKSFSDEAKNEELNALFLQCLVCCTNLEKINNEICGEMLDKEILEKMDWDINSIEIKNEIYNNIFFDNKEQTENLINIIEEIKKKGNIFINNYDNKNINYNSFNNISEVFPKDYYKITEEKNINYIEKRNKKLYNKIFNDKYNSKETKIFKLIIIHKFHNFSCWSKSCITYNLLDNKCRFMTKGPPDKILKHCSPKNIPDIDKLLSRLIKDGYKIIAYATKILQLSQIDKNKNEEYYMKDLSFVGFIIIENKFKKEISQAVEKINKMNCNNSMSSIISTNDNIYNAIEGGLKNGIINKNNVYVFDIGKGDNDGGIIFAKFIYDKEERQEIRIKPRNADNNKTLIKSIYGDKNLSQNPSLTNQSEKKNVNEELITSAHPLESSRKLLYSDSNKTDLAENDIKNTNTIDDKEKNNFMIINETNYPQSPYPKRAFNKKISKVIGKNNTLLYSSQVKNYNREHKQSFYTQNKKNFNISKTEDFLNVSNSGKESKGEELLDNDSYLQFKKRRPTTKANLNYTLRSNLAYSYECLYFKKYDNQIQPFKHECILCFSGKLIEYIYAQKEKNKNKDENGLESYKLDILMTLLKDRVRIFYSMSPEEKSILIKIYRKYLKKSVCLVGNSASDIEAMVLSNIGIMVGPPINFNTLFCNYYLCDKSLLEIEKILKNGRSYYENSSHLLTVNSIFILLSVVLIIFTYKLNSTINSLKYIFLNSSLFLLCLFAFSIDPDYSIDINHLVMNNKLFIIYSMIKLIGTVIIKIIGHLVFWRNYQNNESNSKETNDEILTNYLFIFTWAQITSIIFAFNTQSFFRKHILNNIFFILIFFLFFEYLIINLTLSDISVDSYYDYLFISFNSNTDNADAFEDNHKIIILYIFIVDAFVTYLFNKFLRILFEGYANKINTKIKI